MRVYQSHTVFLPLFSSSIGFIVGRSILASSGSFRTAIVRRCMRPREELENAHTAIRERIGEVSIVERNQEAYVYTRLNHGA